MLYIATKVPEVELTKLKEYFLKVDTNGNGMLTLEEMKKGQNILINQFLIFCFSFSPTKRRIQLEYRFKRYSKAFLRNRYQ